MDGTSQRFALVHILGRYDYRTLLVRFRSLASEAFGTYTSEAVNEIAAATIVSAWRAGTFVDLFE